MSTYYSFQKGKFGGSVGTIYPFPRTLIGDRPTDTDWKTYAPAGYLRCDGSILNADDYIALANIIGVGDTCIYRKDGYTLENRNEDGTGGQIQLPDLGSKFITAFSSNTGLVLDSEALNPNSTQTTERVGIEVELTLNQGQEITFNYSGNFSVPTTNIPVSGNYTLTLNSQSATATIGDEQILSHGHYANSARLKTQNPGSRSIATFAPRIANGDLYSGAGGYNVIEGEELSVEAIGSVESTQHQHSVSRINPTHTTAALLDTFQLDGSAVSTTVTLASEDTTAFNDVTQKFILVEYLIKF
jgi:hypothetical protein